MKIYNRLLFYNKFILFLLAMKKIIWILFTFLFSFYAVVLADFDIRIDPENHRISLVSGDITLQTTDLEGKDYETLFEQKENKNLNTPWENLETTISTGTDVSTTWSINSWVIDSWVNQNIPAKEPTPSYVSVPEVCGYTGTAMLNLATGTELEKAVYWMYHNGLTSYTGEEFLPTKNATRQEAAKFIGQLYTVLWFEDKDKGFDCNFVDADQFDPTLTPHIANVCKLGIFRWNANTHEYMPLNNLTKGEILTVLIRILEDKFSDESIQPRWLEYYVKAKILWITNEKNLNNIERPITREEIALLIYRYKNLLITENGCSNKKEVVNKVSWNISMAVQQVTNEWNSNEENSWLVIEGVWTIDLTLLAWNSSLADDNEFKEAINWMYDHGITSYNKPDDYKPFEAITRAQLAKMFDKFATATNLTTIRNTDCNFTDIDSSEFKSSIVNVCQYWVMKGVGSDFNPDVTVKKSEFIAMLIRLFEGKKLDENTEPRWLSYYQRAIDLSLISAQDTVTFDKEIARYEVAVFLYRLYVRLTMYSNLNENLIPTEIIKTLEIQSLSWDLKKATISVDVAALNDQDFWDGYIEILWTRYKIKKIKTEQYNIGDKSFVWYGDIYNFVTNEKVWIINFIITNKSLTAGSIRILDENLSYTITKDPLVNSYYYLTQL